MTPDPATRAREIVEKALHPYGAPNDLTHRERLLEAALAAALTEPPALTEPRGCPTPGACSCVAALAEARRERDDFQRKYHEAMDILSAWGNIDHAAAVAQLLEARRALEDVQAILAEPGTPPKSVWRAWQARHPAALGRPAPDG